VNQKLRISLLGLVPLVIGACSGEIGNPPGPGASGSSSVSDPMLGIGPGGLPTDPALAPGATAGPPGSGGTTTPPGSTAPEQEDNPPSALPTGDSTMPPVAMDVDPDVVDAIAGAEPLPMTFNGKPIFARTIRLTHEQWERSVQDLLQLDVATGQREGLTADALGVHDFSNNELNLEVSPKLWADYEVAAEALAAEVASSDAALAKIYSGTDAEGFIESFGLRAFRRPLSDEEKSAYQAIYDTGAGLSEGGATPFARGAGLVIEAMLQSPHFLYRTELGESGERLSGYEIAAKLSLMLRGTTPNDELLAAAGNGTLDNDDAVATLAAEMVEEANVVSVMRQYHGELWGFNRYLTIEKDSQTVPEFDKAMNEDLQEAAYLFFDRIYSQSQGVKEMLTSTTAYASASMASFYGVSVSGAGLQEVTLDETRPGYFTQLPFLILNSVNYVPDSIHRGVALNLQLLCADVPPPAVTDLSLPPREADQTNREVVTAGTGVGTCGQGCHSVYINPLGFAFENFDGLGRIRDTDNGKPVDTADTYPLAEGDVTFTGAPDLMQKLAEREQVHACYSKHLAGFFLQRDVTTADEPLIDSLTTTSRAPSSSVKQLLLALVTAPAFTTRSSGDVQ
jgi:Protein of unknown function (DUF1592)/Protein of unknown function (DUF1595)/Protein of unknown function (DUF1588)/Protein of unknown function (DUF1585)/Protein of unknown function (DUF1587)